MNASILVVHDEPLRIRAKETLHMTSATRHIGIFLFPDVEELDAVGPYEVLAYWTRTYPDDGWATCTISLDGAPVTGAKGLSFGTDFSSADAPELDVFLHPGGMGTRPLTKDADHLDYVRGLRESVPLLTSVCTGSLVYAAAGLLADRPATTHWGAIHELAALDASIAIDTEARYVDDGDMITSAGISAGIDMALHLVARLASPERAREVRRGIQYDPLPPV
jgi:transcriptional regulator GlxA family with amidase domain